VEHLQHNPKKKANTMSQKFIFTTSPWKDHNTNKWMLSCFVSIQLDAGRKSTLKDFPDIMNWMSKLQDTDFFVQWGTALPAPITPLNTKWNPLLYSQLFHGNIQVKGFEVMDVSKLMIKSYPAKHINDFIINTYKEVGNIKIDELPKGNFFTKEFKGFKDLARVQLKTSKPLTNTNKKAAIEDFISKEHKGTLDAASAMKKSKVIGFSNQANPGMDFGQFYHFHTKQQQKKAAAIKAVPKPEFEYHDILTLISSYPVIMRKLGLVIDFELPSQPPSAAGTVRILPAGMGLESESVISSPATAYQFTGNGFYATPKQGSYINKGHLTIGTPEFEVVQIDTDGAALKLSSHVDTINTGAGKKLVEKSNYIKPIDPFQRSKPTLATMPTQQGKKDPIPPPDDEDDDNDPQEGLPSLRSAGIGILKNGLAENMLNRFVRSAGVAKIVFNPAMTLNNKALLNTKLIDKKSQPAQLKKPVLGAVPVITRKAIEPQRLQELNTAFEKKDLIPVPTEILYADDLVFGYRMDIAYEDAPQKWYSLHKRKVSYAYAPLNQAKQPVSLTPDEEVDEGCIYLSLTEEEDDIDQQQKLNEVIARWEGWSLAVPPVGKAINPSGKEVSTDEEEKKKYELDPDMPFRLHVSVKPAPGTLPRLRFGKKYRVKIRTVDIAGNGLPHDAIPEQGVSAIKSNIEYRRFEPLSSPQLIQADEITGGDKKMIRDRDGESLQHMVIRSDDNTDTQSYEASNITTVVVDGVAKGTLQYHHEAIRFLTAPRTSQYMAELHGMFDEAIGNPQKAAEIYQFITSRDKEYVDNGSTKAEALPIQTSQVDIDYLADPMAAGVVFTMRSETSFESPWKKGENRKFSFYFDEEVTVSNAGRKFDLQQWRNPKSVKIRLIEGFGQPVWENRVLTIPLPKSSIVEVSYASFWAPEALEKFSALLPTLKLGPAANQVAKKASEGQHWMLSPWRTIRLVHAVQRPIKKPVMTKAFSKAVRGFNETAAQILAAISVHGASTDKLDIRANWSEWVDDLSKKEPGLESYGTHVATVPVIYNDNLLELLKTEKTPNAKADWLPPMTHMFPDTKYRRVTYTPSATSRFREYFTGIIDTARIKKEPIELSKEGDSVVLDILSSARPALPMVEYAVPSFTWAKSDNGNNRTHFRSGNIRVYLRRPWYSSGDDERLAVILPPQGTDPSRNNILKKYCTVWGMDPVFDAGVLNGSNFPQKEHFSGGDVIYDTVQLAEEKQPVTVAAYKVHFDIDKQLHYADIPINTMNAYFPFVKLSLARYQQKSLRLNGTDCCLSGMVAAEWLQLTPARTTRLELGAGNNSFVVKLEGRAPFRNDLRTKISITVERADIAVDEGLFIGLQSGSTDTTILQKDVYLKQTDIRSGMITFAETIRLERNQQASAYRVVIREYELHPEDPLRKGKQGFSIAGRAPLPLGERLVFMDVYQV
jgi:hypothetical protein